MSNNNIPDETYRVLKSKQVAEMIGVDPVTLCRWRYQNRGPRFVKDGNCIRYTSRDVVAWLRGERNNTVIER